MYFLLVFAFLDVFTTAYVFSFCEKYDLKAVELYPLGFNVFTVFWCLGPCFIFLFSRLYTSRRDYSEDTKQTFSSKLKYVILFAVCIKVFALGWNSAIIFMLLQGVR